MNIVNIVATNFLSFKELNYNFKNTPVLIQGLNLTDKGQENNGSGKSALISSIEYALFKNARGIRDIELINNTSDSTYLALTIYCPIRKETLLIERVIKRKGGNESQISINGIVKFAFKDKVVSVINKFILEWIDISETDLCNYFLINKDTFKSIFSSSARERYELINRFSNGSILEGIEKDVQKDVDELSKKLESLKLKKAGSIGVVRTLFKERLKELNRNLNQEKIEEIGSINKDINLTNSKVDLNNKELKDIDLIISNNTKRIDYINNKLKKIENIFKNLTFFDVSDDIDIINKEVLDLEKNISNKRNFRKEIMAGIDDISSILQEIERNIKGSVTCPKCNHKFLIGNPDVDIEKEKLDKEETLNLLDISKDNLDKLNSELQIIINKGSEKNKELLTLRNKQNFGDRWLNRKKKIVNQFTNKINEITDEISKLKILRDKHLLTNEELVSKIKTLTYNKENIKDKELDKVRINELSETIINEGKELKSINDAIKLKKNEIYNLSQWMFNFKKFNLFLANQSLRIIQGYCNKFLKDIESDIQIRWEGKKILADSSIRDEITPYIIRNNDIRSFNTFSGGERVRIEYAMIFTLQTMINKTNRWGGLNFLSSDEVSESLDAQGLSDLMKVFKNINKTILVTTHVVNRTISDNILMIVKENGISKIENYEED